MISLLALLFCLAMFLLTLRQDPPLIISTIQLLCVLWNVPGTVAYFQSL